MTSERLALPLGVAEPCLREPTEVTLGTRDARVTSSSAGVSGAMACAEVDADERRPSGDLAGDASREAAGVAHPDAWTPDAAEDPAAAHAPPGAPPGPAPATTYEGPAYEGAP